MSSRVAAALLVGGATFGLSLLVLVLALLALRDTQLALLDSTLAEWVAREGQDTIPTERKHTFMRLPAPLGPTESVELLLLVTDESGALLSHSSGWPPDADVSGWVMPAPPGSRPGTPGPVIRDTGAAQGPAVPWTASAATAPTLAATEVHPNFTALSKSTEAPQGWMYRQQLISGSREMTLRHFWTSGKDGDIRWVAAHTSPFTVLAGVRLSVITGALVEPLWTGAAAALLAGLLAAALTHRVLALAYQDQQALGAWVRLAADGAAGLGDPPGGSAESAGLRAQLARLRQRLVASLEQAYRFTGDAAHELRSPLTVMQVKVDRLIDRGGTSSEVQADLADIADDIHRLSTLVRRLLWMALADTGRLLLHRTAVNISAMLRELTVDLFVEAGEVSLECQVPPEIWVDGDGELLEHAVANLVSNAVKHNRAGGWVSIVAWREPDSVAVCVRNSVAHPLPALRERVFERFYRGAHARSLREGGSGIGLSLAREIARAHGGDVVVEDAPAGEASFVLRLPVAEQQKDSSPGTVGLGPRCRDGLDM
jgi:signal transduction histidine kinase